MVDIIDYIARACGRRVMGHLVRTTGRAGSVWLLTVLALAAAVPPCVAQTSGESTLLDAEQHARQRLEAIPFLLEPPARLLPRPGNKGAVQEKGAVQGMPTGDLLLHAGSSLATELNSPDLNDLLNGKPYTAANSLERQTLLKANNDHLKEVYDQLVASLKNELKDLYTKVANEPPFSIERAQLVADYNQYKSDCSRSVDPTILAQEQAKCDARFRVLKDRATALEKKIEQKYNTEQEKVIAKYRHGQPGLAEIEQKFKENAELIAKLQALDRRVRGYMAVFANACPKAGTPEEIKYCAMINWDTTDPHLPPIKDLRPHCEAFCSSSG